MNENTTVTADMDSATQQKNNSGSPTQPPVNHRYGVATWFSPFWHDRLVESGLILSMALYYLIGNANIHIGRFTFVHSLSAHPLYTLPLLLIFALLCWYRLPFAVALLPLTLPYYSQQKVIYGHYAFSLAEITLATCVIVALLQMIVRRQCWNYWLSWGQWRDRLGPFLVPMLVFLLMAAVSIGIAFNHTTALRAFREEVFDPFVYVWLVLMCLRTRQDIMRFIGAFVGCGIIIALLGIAQFLLFRNTPPLENGVWRVHAVYGSANSIGLLFDYILPIGFALLLARVSLRLRLIALVGCLPMLIVLYMTQSLGAWVAVGCALLFVTAFSVRNRKILLVGGSVLVVALLFITFAFRTQVVNVFVDHHVSASGKGVQAVSTVTKRIFLWESALHMIHDGPWLGYGMDNWLCYYSSNGICDSGRHYWIKVDPVTHRETGLRYEPELSHPHNIFLHVWVSMGVFGLLAFIAVLVLFFWLFARILRRLAMNASQESEHWRWMTIGVSAAMVAALVQGQVDSAFLEQDLSFCFWIVVVALLLLRVYSGTAWRGKIRLITESTPGQG